MSPLKSTFGAASSFGWLPRVSVNPTLTNVEYTVWNGGYAAGGDVVKDTGASIAGGVNYSITVGAAASPSSFVGGTISKYSYQTSNYQSKNIVNGVSTAYSWDYASVQYNPWQWHQNLFGWQYINLFQVVYGTSGLPGAGGLGSAPINGYRSFAGGTGGAGFTPTSSGLVGFPTSVGCGSGGNAQFVGPVESEAYDYSWNYYYGFNNLYVYRGTTLVSGPNTGSGSYASAVQPSSGGFTMRYSNTQLPLSSTSGDVVYLNSGGYHNYFWKSTGSFIV